MFSVWTLLRHPEIAGSYPPLVEFTNLPATVFAKGKKLPVPLLNQ
jgi:hypothetical protein